MRYAIYGKCGCFVLQKVTAKIRHDIPVNNINGINTAPHHHDNTPNNFKVINAPCVRPKSAAIGIMAFP
jgi:hypothetical protein